MTWKIEFLEEAKKDLLRLNHSTQIQVLKGISKVAQNPLPVSEGGYGKPLGNTNKARLSNLLKIKFKDLGIRVVYKIERTDTVML
ncbi:MAG: type II toxin-antitoxin system RelE/ParE family toxin [Lachnospiraceae bacterium]|nr:type II toxin-antitoxin system RelE/ParE family toxin [Lachnospiraceae bacterium]